MKYNFWELLNTCNIHRNQIFTHLCPFYRPRIWCCHVEHFCPKSTDGDAKLQYILYDYDYIIFYEFKLRVFKATDIAIHLTSNLVQHSFLFSWFQDSLVDPKARLRGRCCSPLFLQDHMSKIVCYPFFSVTLWWDLWFLPLSVWLQVCFERHGYT